ncbi:protein TFG-like isoform X2 [Rhopilema esculentum]|uniref:protein TFG-like isoform X2 n=1 Tax=Rhopilema esculentum TaxID=499914 RepID=UPI0031E33529
MSTGTMNFPSPQIDLSGKLIIKAQLGDDIRRIPIHNEDITYDELLLMMQRLFRGKIRSTDDVLIKYKDEDGDLITIFDSTDLSFAKSLSRYLKITLFVNDKPKPLEHDQVKEIKAELLVMRDKLNDMITRLDAFSEERTVNKQFANREAEATKEVSPPQAPETKAPAKKQQVIDGKAHAALFDPLKTIKNEADTTNEAVDVKPDPFAEIGQQRQQSQPSSLTSNQSYPSSAPAPSSQQGYSAQQQSSYPTHYQQYGNYQSSGSQAVSQSQAQQGQFPAQASAQQGYYGTDSAAYASQSQQAKPVDGNVPPGQYDQSYSQYTSQGYGAAPQSASSYASQSPFPQDPSAAYSQSGSQPYLPGQQSQASQNPYARSMSPRQQYPQPAKGYDVYGMSAGQPQNPGYPQYPQQ